MKLCTGFAAGLIMASLLAPTAWGQTVIVNDGFESYADQAAFKATWVPTVGNGSAAANPADVDSGYLIGCASCAPITDPANYPGIQGQAADHIGATASIPGQVNQWMDDGSSPPFQIAPSATENVFLSADIFVGSSGNERMTVGLRSRAPANILEMGVYNTNTCDPTHPDCTDPAGAGTPGPENPSFVPSTGYAYRIVLFESFGGELLVNPNWQYFELPQDLDRTTDADDLVNIGDIGEGWHTYTAEISPTEITLTLDLFRDGFVNTRDIDGNIIPSATPGPDAEQTWQITTGAAGFNSLRIGGPSGLSSAGPGFMAFDNLLLQLQPPDTGGLLGDFNEDGNVDAADYAIWRKNDGPNAPLPNDNGLTTQADRYNLWVSNFGEMSGSGSGLAAAPEPASVALLMMGLAAMALGRRSR